MFPKHSAFSTSAEQEEHLRRVRESALSTSALPDDDEGLDELRRELKEHIQRYESDRELRDQMDNK
jgi:hypothetical protein